MRMIGPSETSLTAFQIISELASKYSLFQRVCGLGGYWRYTTPSTVALSLQIKEDRMHHISLSSLVVFGAICLLYALVVLAILQFCKVAKLKPNPPESSTVRVELTISARAPADAYPDKSTGPSITTTFVFADEFATTVTDFLAGYHSPSRADFLNFLQQTDGLIADLLINRQYDTLVRSLTLLGKDAEDVTSFLTHCFNCQLASHADELNNEPVSRTA